MPYSYRDLRFAVVTDPVLTVFLYNNNSLKFETKIVIDLKNKEVLSVDERKNGFVPPFHKAQSR